jgi:hypothetical protein
MLVAMYFHGDIQLQDLSSDSSSLTTIFSPYLTSIVAFWFARGQSKEGHREEKMPFYVAFVCSILYNLVLVIVTASIFFREGDSLVKDTIATEANLAGGMSFLVGPAIGFFFGKSGRQTHNRNGK